MKILFEIDDGALPQLEAQFAQAENDPELKEQMREKLLVNWTRSQAEIYSLYVRLDTRLRRVLDDEQVATFWRYNVRLDEPELPDKQRTFFPQQEQSAGN